MIKDYLSTFEAAKLMSVTPDAVLKWIKSGILEARRTPGGHHRIARKSIEALLRKEQGDHLSQQNYREFQYCWEFNSFCDSCPDQCESCVVYKTLAKHCYKMFNFPQEFGHLKLYCETSCEECNYYKFIQTNH